MTAPVRHGIAKLRLALEQKGMRVDVVKSSKAATSRAVVVTGPTSGQGEAARLIADLRLAPHAGPESLLIQMAKCEVSNEQFARYDSGHDSRFEHRSSWWFDKEYIGWPLNRPGQPVVRVSWDEATAFCRWLSEELGEKVTLPTEAQWEWACCAGTASRLNYGCLDTDFSTFGNLADANLRKLADEGWRPKAPDLVPRDARFNDGALVTGDVGRYLPNAWGLHDMHGNAAEWTRSNYRPYTYRANDGRESEATGGKKSIQGGSRRDSVLAYTHGDRYKPLPGYKTMVTHFHVAFTKELMDSGSLDTEPPWIPLMKALGINTAHIFDFHGDGHPTDPGPLRLGELENYFAACRRHSKGDFLSVSGEEANAFLGGHYNIVFPKPVYWTHARTNDRSFVDNHTKYGKMYHTRNAAEVFELMKQEDALVWQTHPRTKGSIGYPDKIRETDYLRSDQWLGTAFKALPVDLSQQRLGEIRCFSTLDDMNNWGSPKYMVGEVDTYKKFPDYDLYGDFFISTGEILIPRWSVEGRGNNRQVVAEVEWTFPMEFVEAVWGDGDKVGRTVVPATEQPPFRKRYFRIPFNATGKKWVRFAAWDSAGNGAFTQPVHLQ